LKDRVYIETTIVSYLAARLSRDLIVAAHQQLTEEWWLQSDRPSIFLPPKWPSERRQQVTERWLRGGWIS